MWKFQNVIDNSVITVPSWNIELISELDNDWEYRNISEVTHSLDELNPNAVNNDIDDDWLPF